MAHLWKGLRKLEDQDNFGMKNALLKLIPWNTDFSNLVRRIGGKNQTEACKSEGNNSCFEESVGSKKATVQIIEIPLLLVSKIGKINYFRCAVKQLQND